MPENVDEIVRGLRDRPRVRVVLLSLGFDFAPPPEGLSRQEMAYVATKFPKLVESRRGSVMQYRPTALGRKVAAQIRFSLTEHGLAVRSRLLGEDQS